jgi:hypothetical protein
MISGNLMTTTLAEPQSSAQCQQYFGYISLTAAIDQRRAV